MIAVKPRAQYAIARAGSSSKGVLHILEVESIGNIISGNSARTQDAVISSDIGTFVNETMFSGDEAFVLYKYDDGSHEYRHVRYTDNSNTWIDSMELDAKTRGMVEQSKTNWWAVAAILFLWLSGTGGATLVNERWKGDSE